MEILAVKDEVQEQSLAVQQTLPEVVDVVDQASYDLANELVDRYAAAMRKLDEIHDPAIKAAHEAHKAAIAAKNVFYKPVEERKKMQSKSMAAWWSSEQDRIAEQRRAAEDEARRKAEDARLREAEQLARAGMTAAADAVIEAPLQTSEHMPEIRGPEKAAGTSYRETWRAEVRSMTELIKAVSAGNIPENVLAPNMTVLNQLAKAYRGTIPIPGVEQIRELVQAKRFA